MAINIPQSFFKCCPSSDDFFLCLPDNREPKQLIELLKELTGCSSVMFYGFYHKSAKSADNRRLVFKLQRVALSFPDGSIKYHTLLPDLLLERSAVLSTDAVSALIMKEHEKDERTALADEFESAGEANGLPPGSADMPGLLVLSSHRMQRLRSKLQVIKIKCSRLAGETARRISLSGGYSLLFIELCPQLKLPFLDPVNLVA